MARTGDADAVKWAKWIAVAGFLFAALGDNLGFHFRRTAAHATLHAIAGLAYPLQGLGSLAALIGGAIWIRRGQWIALIGVISAASGIGLNILAARLSFGAPARWLGWADIAYSLSIPLALLGLAFAMVGGAMWAQHAAARDVMISGAALGAVAVLLHLIADANLPGPSGLFWFIIPLMAASAALLLAMGASRSRSSRS